MSLTSGDRTGRPLDFSESAPIDARVVATSTDVSAHDPIFTRVHASLSRPLDSPSQHRSMRAPFAPSTDVLAHDIYTHDLARSRPPIGRLIVAAGIHPVTGHRHLSDFPPEMQTGTMGRKGYAVWDRSGQLCCAGRNLRKFYRPKVSKLDRSYLYY